MSERAAKNTTSRRGAALASTLHHRFFIFQAFSSGLIYEERHINSSAIVSGCLRSKGNIWDIGSHQLQPAALLTLLPEEGHPLSHSELQMVPRLVIVKIQGFKETLLSSQHRLACEVGRCSKAERNNVKNSIKQHKSNTHTYLTPWLDEYVT